VVHVSVRRSEVSLEPRERIRDRISRDAHHALRRASSERATQLTVRPTPPSGASRRPTISSRSRDWLHHVAPDRGYDVSRQSCRRMRVRVTMRLSPVGKRQNQETCRGTARTVAGESGPRAIAIGI